MPSAVAYGTAMARSKAKVAPRPSRKPSTVASVIVLEDADDRHQAKQARAALADPKNRKRKLWSQVKTDLGL